MTYKDLMDSGKVFSALSEQESKVIKLKYGFEDGTLRNSTEVANVLQISRERVRQIEVSAKNKITIILRYEGRNTI
jgi:DNA-directed RNA polymerase sigma subunit (sigma70/sigma32)